MSTRYAVSIVKIVYDERGHIVSSDVLADMPEAPAWEVSPALRQLAKKIHESPPPVILEGQGELV